MKKILLPFDGIHFSESVFEFVKKLNELNPILLIGVFLPQISYANVWSYADGMGGPLFVPALEETDTEAIEKNIDRFQNLCQRNAIEYRIRKDLTDLALPELKKESRFADFMVINSETFYENMGTGNPNTYLKDALHEIECPAIVLSNDFVFPTSNILSYDGSESSVYAIKQFIYLFPELINNSTILLYISSESEKNIPNEPYIEEFVARHFNDVTITKIDINFKKYFSTWIADKKSAILITGSFGRSTFSNFFKKSFVTDVIKEHKLPVFVSHK